MKSGRDEALCPSYSPQEPHWDAKEQAQQPEVMWLSPELDRACLGGGGSLGVQDPALAPWWSPGILFLADPMSPGPEGCGNWALGSGTPPMLHFPAFLSSSEGQKWGVWRHISSGGSPCSSSSCVLTSQQGHTPAHSCCTREGQGPHGRALMALGQL